MAQSYSASVNSGTFRSASPAGVEPRSAQGGRHAASTGHLAGVVGVHDAMARALHRASLEVVARDVTVRANLRRALIDVVTVVVTARAADDAARGHREAAEHAAGAAKL